MTPNEITTLIAGNLDKELDIPFKKQLYERVKFWRSTLIKQSLDKTRKDAKYFRQVIYLDMEKFDPFTCSPDLSCFAARTTIDVPAPIRISDAGQFEYVGGIDGMSPFGYADDGTLPYLKAGKYSRLFNYYRMENARPYVMELPNLPKIRIAGVFSNPEEAMIYASCDAADHNCDWWNQEIPMSNDITQRVVQCILTVDYNRDKTPENNQITVNGDKK